MADLSRPLMIIHASPARRVFGAVVMTALGAALIAAAFNPESPSAVGIALLAGLGSLMIWQALRMYRATERDIVLTREGLFDTTGACLAPLDRIAAVDRGVFAFKPSNGFVLRLTEPAPRAWVPGVWWRVGTRVGVGGATSGQAAREMADLIHVLKTDPRAILGDAD